MEEFLELLARDFAFGEAPAGVVFSTEVVPQVFGRFALIGGEVAVAEEFGQRPPRAPLPVKLALQPHLEDKRLVMPGVEQQLRLHELERQPILALPGSFVGGPQAAVFRLVEPGGIDKLQEQIRQEAGER